jgi:hypothetical protein
MRRQAHEFGESWGSDDGELKGGDQTEAIELDKNTICKGTSKMEWVDDEVNATHVIRRFHCSGFTIVNTTDATDTAAFEAVWLSLHSVLIRRHNKEDSFNESTGTEESSTKRKGRRATRFFRRMARYLIAVSVDGVAAARFV